MGPRSYLSLGEPVGQIHLEKEKQRGFPSGLLVVLGGNHSQAGQGSWDGGISHSPSGWDIPKDAVTPCRHPAAKGPFPPSPTSGAAQGLRPQALLTEEGAARMATAIWGDP